MKRITTHASLKSWRKAQGFNQRQAADFLGVPQSIYAKVEVGAHAPRPTRGKNISDKTGVPFEIVMGVA